MYYVCRGTYATSIIISFFEIFVIRSVSSLVVSIYQRTSQSQEAAWGQKEGKTTQLNLKPTDTKAKTGTLRGERREGKDHAGGSYIPKKNDQTQNQEGNQDQRGSEKTKMAMINDGVKNNFFLLIITLM